MLQKCYFFGDNSLFSLSRKFEISKHLQEIAKKYEVKAMPTFLLIKEGVIVGRLVGANLDEIKKRIETLLQSNSDFVV